MTNSLLDFTLDDLLRAQELFDLAKAALDKTGATGTAIALKQGDAYVCCAVAGETAPTLGVSLQSDEGITGACIQSGQTEICHDVVLDDRVNAAACELLQIASVIAVPVVDGGEVIAVLEALSRQPYAFDAAQQAALEGLARQLHPSPSSKVNSVQFEPPVTIDSFPRIGSTAGAEEEALPESGPLIVAQDVRTEVQTAYFRDSEHGSWVRGMMIAVVFVCAVVGSALLLPRLERRTQSASSPAQTSAPVPSIATPAVAPSPDIRPKPGTPEYVAELQVAAAAGNGASQLKLAQAYARGLGVPKDLVSAYAWYIAATASGEEDQSKFLPSLAKQLSAAETAEVRVKVAEMFWKGSGVKQESTAAYIWLLLAEAAGSSNAKAYEQRLAAEMKESDIRDAEQRANTWLRQHRQPALRR